MTADEQRPGAQSERADPLWLRPGGGKRGPKPKFTVTQIAEAGIRIADVEGLAAVTMQRIAQDLGTAKMALYRYVPGRSDLDAIMLDCAFSMPDSHEHSDWRDAVVAWAEGVHGRALIHPWSVELAQRPHRPGPCELAWYEEGLTAMASLQLHGSEKLDVLALLAGHAMSIVRQEAGSTAPEHELASSMARVLDDHPGEYPLTRAAFAEPGGVRGDALRFGVDRIVAGIDALESSRRRD
jgi:AcrR family transcriptional regulator